RTNWLSRANSALYDQAVRLNVRFIPFREQTPTSAREEAARMRGELDTFRAQNDALLAALKPEIKPSTARKREEK
ncbi:hypothetical protein SAMN04244574_04277, partial [Azotobacter beijerinckii]